MKIAPIVRAIEAARERGTTFKARLVHTGQHYDQTLSGRFFDELELPLPDVNLEVGSGSQAEQTGAIMCGYERLIARDKPDLCVVVGDVTSTMACAITAQKMGVPVAHVEGGIRSGDWRMPEEINRLVTDAVTDYFFTTSETANANLRASGVSDERIFFVGNTMIDSLLRHLSELKEPAVWQDARLQVGEYFVLTLHRPSNVDDPNGLSCLLHGIVDNARDNVVVFPVHPRTNKTLEAIGELPIQLRRVEPLGYLEFNYLVKHARAVITDSGGVTEEATVLGVPCLTLRDTTERPETVTIGTNELVGTDPSALPSYFERLFAGTWKKGGVPPLWDGRAAERIVECLEQLLA